MKILHRVQTDGSEAWSFEFISRLSVASILKSQNLGKRPNSHTMGTENESGKIGLVRQGNKQVANATREATPEPEGGVDKEATAVSSVVLVVRGVNTDSCTTPGIQPVWSNLDVIGMENQQV
ncbi:hypothetical protein TGARI_283870 [Toxoplasma gondii ARI]|uniref:Uncharacterized protein n=2 Tax=Toxoplasma gondii TaxID=5811 RepID=A0A2G8Y023_TOXGO|nr:hypothetical protein TGARI_283870 [Toxoplasma gondii ARI]PIM00349.1 hypothetical protein TGCOUG_283870 [Toxoplasma gondii COUG]